MPPCLLPNPADGEGAGCPHGTLLRTALAAPTRRRPLPVRQPALAL